MIRLLALGALLVTSACAVNPSFERTALHYNRVVADTNNEQLFLNIIRAKEREPMYFTGFSQLSGDLTYGVSTGATASLPETGIETETTGAAITRTVTEAVDTFTPTITAQVVNNPSFDFQVLDTQEFFRGITESVEEETVVHFLHQGWPPEILAALLIERADFVVGSGENAIRIGDIDNEPVPYLPAGSSSPVDFGEILNCIELRPFDGRSVEVKNVSVPSFLSEDDTKGVLSRLSLPEDAHFGFDESDGSLKLRYRTDDEIQLFATQPRKDESNEDFEQDCTAKLKAMMTGFDLGNVQGDPQIYFKTGKRIRIALATSDKHVQASDRVNQNDGTCKTVGDTCKDIEVSLIFRSVQGAIYFLGEYVRADFARTEFEKELDETGKTEAEFEDPPQGVYKLKNERKVLKVSPGSSEDAFVSTELNGDSYQVERTETDAIRDEDYSLTSFALINQMLNLQKSASERPTTSAVRVR